MRALPLGVVLVAIASPAHSQGTVVVPNAYATTQAPDNNNSPFNFLTGGGLGRYQQVYEAADVVAGGASFPMLITELAFRPGIGGNGSYGLDGRTLTIDLSLGNAAVGADAMTFDFASNLSGTATTVYAGSITFPTVASFPGTGPYPFVWTIPLQTPYLYTGASNLLLDVAITATTGSIAGGSAPLDAIFATGDPVARRYNQGNPAATNANGGESLGLVTQFTYGPAGPSFVPFGAGCAGAGGFVPAIGSVGLPGLGNASFAATLSNAAGGSVAILAIGLSDDFWIGLPLPFDLTPVGAPGCFLLVSDEVLVLTTAGGTGPGAGTASIGLPVPPTPALAGGSAHLQWLVFDPIVAAIRASNAATATVY